nr:hypothetical protein BaRGS_031720 [Batillaria attramentaria]
MGGGERVEVGVVPHVLCTLFLLMMLAGRSLASPWIQESPHSVKLRAQFCRPVSEEHLRNMLGAAYDPSRMANLDPAASKRSDSDDLDHQGHHDLEGEGFDTYYMDDDPNAGRYFDEDIVDIVTEREGEGGKETEPKAKTKVEAKVETKVKAKLKKVWGRLKDGYFPQYLLDGRCMTDKCFYRLYDCLPQQYPVKVLKRDPDYCNPLPTIGANSTYEQRWTIVRYYVTVGCKCSTTEQQQRSSSGRRRKS